MRPVSQPSIYMPSEANSGTHIQSSLSVPHVFLGYVAQLGRDEVFQALQLLPIDAQQVLPYPVAPRVPDAANPVPPAPRTIGAATLTLLNTMAGMSPEMRLKKARICAFKGMSLLLKQAEADITEATSTHEGTGLLAYAAVLGYQPALTQLDAFAQSDKPLTTEIVRQRIDTVFNILRGIKDHWTTESLCHHLNADDQRWSVTMKNRLRDTLEIKATKGHPGAVEALRNSSGNGRVRSNQMLSSDEPRFKKPKPLPPGFSVREVQTAETLLELATR